MRRSLPPISSCHRNNSWIKLLPRTWRRRRGQSRSPAGRVAGPGHAFPAAAGIPPPSSEACTVQTGSPVEPSPSGAAAGADKATQASHSLRARHRARALALEQRLPVIVERHRLGLGEPIEHDAAELRCVALAIGVERPARLPRVDLERQRPRRRDRGLHRGDLGVELPRRSRSAVLSRASASSMARLAPRRIRRSRVRRRGFCGAGTRAGPNRPG